MCMPLMLRMGVKAYMTGTEAVDIHNAVVQAYLSGDEDKALHIYYTRLLPYLELYTATSFHKSLKFMLKRRGVIKTDKLIFFHSEELQNRFYNFWRTISRRYSKDCDIVAYELLNEIVSPEVVAEWNMIATKAVAAIREDSPDTWVIYGGVCYNAVSSVEKLPNPNDDKVVHTFHCYEPMIFTHQGAFWVTGMPLDFRTSYPVTESTYREMLTKLPPELANAIDPEAIKLDGEAFFESIFESAIAAAEKNNVPLYCGEYGVIDRASCEDTLRWVEKISSVFRKHDISRSYWNFKSMDYEICGERFAKDIDKLVKLL